TGLAKKVSGKTWFQLKHGTRTGWAAIAHLKHVPAVAPSATTTTAKNVRLETTANLFLRSSAPSGSVLATMKKGAVVTTTGLAKKVSGKTWFQLKHGTRTGWAAIAHLKHVPAVAPAPVPTPIPTPPPTAPAPEVRYSATANVNLRASAPAGPVLALIAEGGTVTATGRTATHGATTWREVTFGSTTGWVSGDYLAQYVPPGAGGVGPVPANFTVSGAGWGHGVGMSQYGAQGMAKAGLGSDDILEHYYAPARTALTTNHAASEIRVHLLSTAGSTITPSNGRLRVLNGTKVLATTGSPVQLKVSGGKVVATVAGKALAAAGTLTVQWEGTRHWAGSQATTVSVPGAASGYASGTYRHGRIEASVLGGRLNLVNQLRMNDEYLYGLSEMPSSWAPAALQAQAIAGRTYAMRNMGGLKSACACNVYDEVASQKFTGWIKENEGAGVSGAKWKAAVDATQRKAFGVPMSATVVQYNGALIDAVYFSSSGGSTRTAQSVWGSHHAYLQARPDPHSVTAASGNPNRAWSYTATQARVASAFRVADVVSVSIARNSDLTIQSATATTRSGATSTISGAAFRAALPTKSAWVGGVSAR
ncbi:SpoIID/LytB domain-containing protein, partial [Arthrobacter halodurans]